jgi:4-hydroxybenzoate polyprenyltransferase
MMILPYARLMRLPNVFTAFADIGLGLAVTARMTPIRSGILSEPKAYFLLAASGLMYLAGMVLNDYFDRKEDAKERPNRPIPRGQISPTTALTLGLGLLGGGLVLTGLTGNRSGLLGSALAFAILAYNIKLKHTPFGPVSMALCRFLNVLLGLSLADSDDVPIFLKLHLAGVVAIYIVGVTWFARTEEKRSDPRKLRYAAGVLIGAALLALAIPTQLPSGSASLFFPYLLGALVIYLGTRVVQAIRDPAPAHVQAAIKRLVLSLILVDAVLASGTIGTSGLILALLLIPAVVLGKWVYST